MTRREFLHTIGASLALSVVPDWLKAAGRRSGPIDTTNYVLGTQTIGPNYGFTNKTRLVETAERIAAMGSNILKFSMGRRYCGDQYHLPRRDDVRTLVDLASKEPSVKGVLDMPFAYYHIWAYPFAGGTSFKDGLPDDKRRRTYDEIHALAVHLLTTYRGTGKTFLLGHWEGDWHLHQDYNPRRDPAPAAIRGMIDWLNVRQRAIDDAKRKVNADNVHLYHYTEVNLVQKAIKGGKCLTNNVLPETDVDYVSYSSYDTTNPHKGDVGRPLHEALDYIESKLAKKKGLGPRRVFIGEYGIPLVHAGSPQKQDAYARDVCLAALEWGCPFVLYWQMYCNEKMGPDRYRGFWLVDDHNRIQPFYHTLRTYHADMKRAVAEIKTTRRRPPTDVELRELALGLMREKSSPRR